MAVRRYERFTKIKCRSDYKEVHNPLAGVMRTLCRNTNRVKANDTLEFVCRLVKQTQLAFYVCIDGRNIWVPKSESTYFPDHLIIIPRWVALEKGLIH